MRRAVIVQGLGFGDEGKGATVDFLARELSAELVVRYCGGSQAGHNVELPDGSRHTFSQFGAGTLAGAATYLGEQLIIDPVAMHREAAHLHELTGDNPFHKLTIHPQALITTIYHQGLNRLRELSRGANRHGSCGHGIGEARHYWLKYGRDAIFAEDLHHSSTLEPKLELLRQRSLLDAQELIHSVPAAAAVCAAALYEPAAKVARELAKLGEVIEVSAHTPPFRTVILEGAQGVLLDEWRGFHPHTTWSTVTLQHALSFVEHTGVTELCTLGLTRAYATRHGAGPLPTFDARLNTELSDPGNPRNAWQGDIRFGWLDFVLLRYAAGTVGGPLDGLVINNLDELDRLAPKVCVQYRADDGRLLRDLPPAPLPSLAAQEDLTKLLHKVTPIYQSASPAEIFRLGSEVAPLAITASGATWQHRVLHGLRFRAIEGAGHGSSCNTPEESRCWAV